MKRYLSLYFVNYFMQSFKNVDVMRLRRVNKNGFIWFFGLDAGEGYCACVGLAFDGIWVAIGEIFVF